MKVKLKQFLACIAFALFVLAVCALVKDSGIYSKFAGRHDSEVGEQGERRFLSRRSTISPSRRSSQSIRRSPSTIFTSAQKEIIDTTPFTTDSTTSATKRKSNVQHEGTEKHSWDPVNWAKVPQEWVSTMKKRKHLLDDICQMRKESHANRTLNKWIIVDDNHKFILCCMLKAASRNWRNVYQILSGRQDPSSKKIKFLPSIDNYTSLASFSYDKASERLHNYLKVLVVRHPLERLVSVYKEQILKSHLGPRIMEHANEKYKRNYHSKRKLQLSDLLRYIVDNGPNNRHWGLVEDSCMPCDVQYDVIVHHESLHTDATNVMRLIGAEDLIGHFPPSHRTIEDTQNETLIQRYYKGIDKKLLKKVWDVYKEDASYHGYTLDL